MIKNDTLLRRLYGNDTFLRCFPGKARPDRRLRVKGGKLRERDFFQARLQQRQRRYVRCIGPFVARSLGRSHE